MIDGNLGITATIGEQLLQSHDNMIHLLPALPSAHKTGYVEGLVARGGFIVDLKWNNGKLVETKIHSKYGVPNTLRYKNKTISLELNKGESKTFKSVNFQ